MTIEEVREALIVHYQNWLKNTDVAKLMRNGEFNERIPNIATMNALQLAQLYKDNGLGAGAFDVDVIVLQDGGNMYIMR
jgi:hypothetical protein